MESPAHNGYLLLLIWTINKQARTKRSITITATNLPSDSGGITAEDLLKRAASAIKLGSLQDLEKSPIPWAPTGDPTEISIGGKRVARLDLTGRINNYTARWSQLAIIDRGYIVQFHFVDESGDATQIQAVQSIKSLRFFGSAN